MLGFTTAAESSLDAFLSVSAASRYEQQLGGYAESLLRRELTKPDWCLLAMQAGTPVARAALWAPPGQDVPTDTVLIEADWSDTDLSEGTRDSWLSKTIEERGPVGAAQAGFCDAQAMEHRPDWCELAYTEDGAVAGVIMVSRSPSTAVIYFVGVVPEHRGRGLAPLLVRRGTERLVEGGATEIRGDCDRDYVGMVKGFERAGYEQFARRRTYQRSIR